MAVGILSGNRNFEGRINPHTRANYLASPLLCVAYALAGTVKIDFNTEPLGALQWRNVFVSEIHSIYMFRAIWKCMKFQNLRMYEISKFRIGNPILKLHCIIAKFWYKMEEKLCVPG